MHRITYCAVALAAAMPLAQAQESLPQMRDELKKLQQRVEELEGRVKDAQTRAADLERLLHELQESKVSHSNSLIPCCFFRLW